MDALIRQSYQILEANPKMTDAQLKKQYRIMAKRYHPDISKSSDAETHFQAVQNAYDLIILYRSGQYYSRPEAQTYSQPTSSTTSSSAQQKPMDEMEYQRRYEKETYKGPSPMEKRGYYLFIFGVGILLLFSTIYSFLLGTPYFIFFLVVGVLMVFFVSMLNFDFSFRTMIQVALDFIDQHKKQVLQILVLLSFSLYVWNHILPYSVWPSARLVYLFLAYLILFRIEPRLYDLFGFRTFIPWAAYLLFLYLNFQFTSASYEGRLHYMNHLEGREMITYYWDDPAGKAISAEKVAQARAISRLTTQQDGTISLRYSKGLFGVYVVRDIVSENR